MIAVVDYGVGNLYSLTCSLRHIGAQCTVTREENALRAADSIILPVVGALANGGKTSCPQAGCAAVRPCRTGQAAHGHLPWHAASL